MSDTVLPPPSDEPPIDAEFEPAKKVKDTPPKVKRGPGWFSFLLLGAVSLGALGVSVLSGGILPEFGADKGVDPAVIERIKVDLEAAASDRATLRTGIDAAQSEAARALASARDAASLSADVSAAVDLLEADLDAQAARAPSPAIGTEDTGSGPDFAPILARIEGLEAMVSELSEGGRPEGANDTAPSPVDLSAIETDLAGVRADVDRLRDELTTLRGDLSGLIAAQDAANAQEADVNETANAAVALSAIEAAARRGQPFQTAYEALRQSAPELRGVSSLRPLAASGAPTLPDLREMFRPLKRDALRVHAEGEGQTQSLLNTLFGDGIKVRKAGEIDVAATLDTAESALVTGDLETSLDALQALPADIQAVFTDWRQSAQNRLTLEDSLDTLRLAMIAKDRP